MIVKCAELGYLEDSPVFESDRRVAHAYFRGLEKDKNQGMQAIKDERQ